MMIKECIKRDEIVATFSVMKQLRPKLENEENYFQLVQSLRKTEKYRLIAMFNNSNKCLVLAGIRVKCSLFSNGTPEMHVDDFVTDTDYRSCGLGKKMFEWLKSECRKLGYSTMILDSGTQRTDAHNFYYREGMQVTALHFSWTSDLCNFHFDI